MSQDKKQKILLVVLLFVLVAMVWWRFGPNLGGGGGRGGGPITAGFSSRRATTEADALPEVVDLRLDDLQAVSGDFEQGRDPFNQREPEPEPAPPPPETSRTVLQEAMERARQQRNEESEARMAQAVPKPPPVDVVFLGSFGPSSSRLAVFSDGSEIFNVGEGDVLKNKFIVVRIGFESADLGFVGFPEAPAQRLEIGG